MRRIEGLKVDRSLFELPSQSICNPTVWLFVAILTIFVLTAVLFALGITGRFVTAATSTVCLYCFYTVSHEAVHGNAHPKPWINHWLGRISAAIEGMSFPLFRILHLQHHAFTNDPEKDPDYVIGRQPRWLLPAWTAVRLGHDNLFMFRRGLWSIRLRQLWEHVFTITIQISLVAWAVFFGHFLALFWIWIFPVVVSGALLVLTVAWAVHFPHRSQHPLENTSMFHGRLLQVLMLNQNYHLVHHLWTRIPWYRYSSAVEIAKSVVTEHRRLANSSTTGAPSP